MQFPTHIAINFAARDPVSTPYRFTDPGQMKTSDGLPTTADLELETFP